MLFKQWVGVENVLPVSVPCRQVFNNLWQIFNLQGSKCIVLYIYHKTRATNSNYHAHKVKGGNGSFPHSRNQTELSMKKSETLPYYKFWIKSKNFLNNINTKKKNVKSAKNLKNICLNYSQQQHILWSSPKGFKWIDAAHPFWRWTRKCVH